MFGDIVKVIVLAAISKFGLFKFEVVLREGWFVDCVHCGGHA